MLFLHLPYRRICSHLQLDYRHYQVCIFFSFLSGTFKARAGEENKEKRVVCVGSAGCQVGGASERGRETLGSELPVLGSGLPLEVQGRRLVYK